MTWTFEEAQAIDVERGFQIVGLQSIMGNRVSCSHSSSMEIAPASASLRSHPSIRVRGTGLAAYNCSG